MHDAILDDLVYPTEIVGKRIRYRVDGSKVLKVRHTRHTERAHMGVGTEIIQLAVPQHACLRGDLQ